MNTLYGIGLKAAAEKILGAFYDALPCDRGVAARLAEITYHNHQDRFPVGRVERNRFLLYTMFRSMPSSLLTSAYFENLDQILKKRERRAAPGQVVLGLGTGRSGSTTLTAILASIDQSLATHENPPLINWQPLPEQIEFHVKRLAILSWYHPVTFSCAFYNLGMLDTFLERFPEGKVIGTYRETESCARSFFAITGSDTNRWVAPHNGIWSGSIWDPLFPNYPIPVGARRNRDEVKLAHITRYVVEYNSKLKLYAERFPQRLLVVRTEELDTPSTRRRISEFLGTPVTTSSLRLNVGSIDHWGDTWI